MKNVIGRSIERLLQRRQNGRIHAPFPTYERREDLLARNSSASAVFLDRVTALDETIHECVSVSNRYTGIESATSAHYYASVLFSVLCGKAISFAFLVPYSDFAERKIEHWDYASLAVLSRTILEARIAFFYIGSETMEESEWYCRWNVMNLHDCNSRAHMFKEMGNSEDTVSDFEDQAKALKDQLRGNNHFRSLPDSDQRKYLNGKNAYIFPLEEISDRAGIDKEMFRWLYKFLSSHVHNYPMSFYRMGSESDRGRGVHCQTEENYSQMCISMVLSILINSRDEMHRLFGSRKADGTSRVCTT